MTPEGIVVKIQGFEVIVDEEDVARIEAMGPWRAHRGSQLQYFVHTMPRPAHMNLLLHRFIAGASEGQEVDHINGNVFDNRKSNLRICTHAENQRNTKRKSTNTSGYKGVSYDKRRGKWRARITLNGKEKWIGSFDTAIEAADAYRKASRNIHGEFGRVA